MRTCSCVVVLLVLVVVAGAQDDAVKKDVDSLQGVWQAVSAEIEGKAVPEQDVKRLKVTFKGNKASHPDDGGQVQEVAFKLDPGKTPKSIDAVPTAGNDVGKTLRGIYAIEGDSLKICMAKAGGTRPTAFKADSAVVNFVFKRDKQ